MLGGAGEVNSISGETDKLLRIKHPVGESSAPSFIFHCSLPIMCISRGGGLLGGKRIILETISLFAFDKYYYRKH
jgi:hypothetical protein